MQDNLRKLAWFAVLWAAGVVTVGVAAYLIKLIIGV
ncbi:MAG: DUF2474 family protein [Sphingomonadales bacterium]|nr:DUF2474 family protein [Sphingomonadales bacterium]